VAVTSNTIANQAIGLMGDNQPSVVGNAPSFDNSPAGVALAHLYAPAVATVARQWGSELARNAYTLVPTGNTPLTLWTQEYAYPPNGIEVWQLIPAAIADANNPLPVNWDIANTEVGGTQVKVIQTNLANAIVIYNNNPNENTWDPLFREAVVRLLASELASWLAGRPDTAEALLQSGAAFESLGEGRPD